jgi:hypothetical protein
MEFQSAGDGAFDGSFSRSFSGKIDSSNVLGYRSPVPSVVPEPTVLVIFVVGGAGLALRRWRRRRLGRPATPPPLTPEELLD